MQSVYVVLLEEWEVQPTHRPHIVLDRAQTHAHCFTTHRQLPRYQGTTQINLAHAALWALDGCIAAALDNTPPCALLQRSRSILRRIQGSMPPSLAAAWAWLHTNKEKDTFFAGEWARDGGHGAVHGARHGVTSCSLSKEACVRVLAVLQGVAAVLQNDSDMVGDY